jgi:Methyltransferase domain
MNIEKMRHILDRRADLKASLDYGNLSRWEESCVPSYCHPNILAAGVSWLRLFSALDLAVEFKPDATRVLDFGSSVGEIGQLLRDPKIQYDFVEQDDAAADFLISRLTRAGRQTLETAPKGAYEWVFAIDALEHNHNFAELLEALSAKLAPDGILIICGPTENALYRVGRWIVGFNSHYHVTTIYHIETAAGLCRLRRVGKNTTPFGIPLFRISAWRRA